MSDNIITLTNQFGKPVPFEFLDLIKYEGKEYVVLLPVDENDGQVVILQVLDCDAGHSSYVGVEDEELLEKIFGIFRDRHSKEFNFVD